jgi:hypothetical protein
MTTKDTLAAYRLRVVKGALAKLERELEDAGGPRKEMLRKWIAEVEQTLRAFGQYGLH